MLPTSLLEGARGEEAVRYRGLDGAQPLMSQGRGRAGSCL